MAAISWTYPQETLIALRAQNARAEAAAPTNGSHELPVSPPSAPPGGDRPREAADQPPQREFHSEPREPAAAHEATPIAHFEPAPKPDTAAAAGKPYVVWSSAPPKDIGSRGSEE
jgi:hypothetical protein